MKAKISYSGIRSSYSDSFHGYHTLHGIRWSWISKHSHPVRCPLIKTSQHPISPPLHIIFCQPLLDEFVAGDALAESARKVRKALSFAFWLFWDGNGVFSFFYFRIRIRHLVGNWVNLMKYSGLFFLRSQRLCTMRVMKHNKITTSTKEPILIPTVKESIPKIGTCSTLIISYK